MYYNTMIKANSILATHLEKALDSQDKKQAVEEIKEILTKCFEILQHRASGAQKQQRKNAMVILRAMQAGRQKHVMEELAADVQDMVKKKQGKYIMEIHVGETALSFLPDVDIPNTEEKIKDWQAFFKTLNPRCRTGIDPETNLRGKIPFRKGVWFTDMAPIGDNPLHIVEDIKVVQGDLFIHGRQPTAKHKVTVEKNLHADLSLLENKNSPIKKILGEVKLYDEEIRIATDMELSPDKFLNWGLKHGTMLTLNDRITYLFHVEEDEEETFYAFIECPGGRAVDYGYKSLRYLWSGKRWNRFKRELPSELVYNLRKKFQRICAQMGIGKEFLIARDDPVEEVDKNFGRLTVFFKLCRGEHDKKAEKALKPKDKKIIEELENGLERIRMLAVGEGAKFNEDMAQVTKQIQAELDRITDEKLLAVHTVINDYSKPIDLQKVKNDKTYLKLLLSNDINFNDILNTAGKTIVFLNNFFISKEAKSLAAGKISGIRKNLRAIMGQKEANSALMDLLKWVKPQVFEAMRRSHRDKREDILNLEKNLNRLNAQPPIDMMEEFNRELTQSKDEKQIQDVKFLSTCLQFGNGSLNQLFQPHEKDGAEEKALCDPKVFKSLLLVNLQSFIVDDVKRTDYEFDETSPKKILQHLYEKLAYYEPVIKTYCTVV
ncbi:MAG: hypothetical protein SVS15_04930 [Thermodesulfobacteriota bacterium]|nr:hypothetical protein [Thermodesulfobacteriota bacterium]